MRARIVDTETLRSISPAALAAYIRGEGWRRIESYGDHSDVYDKVGGQELIIPATAALADYASVVSSVLLVLSQDEQRDELQIFRDLILADRDVIRVRALDSDDDGSVRIEAGVDLVLQARDLLLSAACSAKEPRAMYRAGKIKDAASYIERVRLGQTEQGSFIVTLLAPVPPNLERDVQSTLWPMPAEEPFERRVTRTLAEGLAAAKRATEGVVRGSGTDAFRAEIKQGVSANSCEALAILIDRGRGLEVSVTWARTRPTPEPRCKVSFSLGEGEILKEAARHFRSLEPRPDETLEALVIALDRKPEREEGRVTLRTVLDGHPMSVTSVLPKALYSEATIAHDLKQAIALTGDLVRHNHRWRLDNPRNLKVIPDEDE